MQLSAIEQQVITNMHGLPSEQQQAILAFSLFLINKASSYPAKSMDTGLSGKNRRADLMQPASTAGEALKEFLAKYELDPIDIDTAIFEQDRETETDRDFKL